MELPAAKISFYRDFSIRLDKVEASLGKIAKNLRVLNLQIKKNQSSPLVRLAEAICKIIDFILKPITWPISFFLNERNIKPRGRGQTDFAALIA